jgi:hypothetical protein
LPIPDIFEILIHYKSIYENSEWPSQRPGFGFIFHFLIIGFTARLLFISCKDIIGYNLKAVSNLLPMLWLIVLFSLLAMSLSSLGTRFLLPFSFIITLVSMTFINKLRNINRFYFSVNIFIILGYSLFMVYQNGGNLRI